MDTDLPDLSRCADGAAVSPDHLYASGEAAEGPQLEAQLQGL
jgi:hypothetical protein